MAALTTQLATANINAQILKTLALQVYNDATALLGQVASLQSSVNAGTSFSGAPDGNSCSDLIADITGDLTVLDTRITKMKQDLTIPT